MAQTYVETLQRRMPPQGPISFEAFLDWCDENTHVEWVDGKVVEVSPASRHHQEFVDFLTAIFRIFVETHRLGTVLSAPFPMRLEAAFSVREPDLLFVSRHQEGRLKETYLDGPAELVVEVVSPESRLRDRGTKFAEYEAGGVQEYWLFDLDQARADFYRLGKDGRYRLVDADPDGVYRSQVVSGIWLKLDWLWQRPLPPVLEVLKALGVLEG